MISILIVDDEPLIRETLAGMLEKRYPGRFHVTLAGDGRQRPSNMPACCLYG